MKRHGLRRSGLIFLALLVPFLIPLFRDGPRSGPLFAGREVAADANVLPIFQNVTTDGTSNPIFSFDQNFAGQPCASTQIQVVWTSGTPAVTLEATINGADWMPAITTWSASADIHALVPCGGAIRHRLRIASCGGTCSVSAWANTNGVTTVSVQAVGPTSTPSSTPTRTATPTP